MGQTCIQPVEEDVEQIKDHDDDDKIPEEEFSVPVVDHRGDNIKLHFYPKRPIHE